jgi:hypothetical protein
MKKLLLALALLAAFAMPAYAQLATGNVYGIFTDESQAPMPGATVTLKGPDATRTTTTGSDGRFRFVNINPGMYELTVARTSRWPPARTWTSTWASRWRASRRRSP